MPLGATLQEFITEIQSEEATNEQLNQELQAAQASAQALQDQLTQTSNALAAAQSQDQADEAQIAQLQAQLQPIKDQLAAAQATVASLQAQLDVDVFDALETTPWLLAGGTAANTNQTGNTTVATQGQTGITSAFFDTHPAGPWADAYWYKRLGARSKRNKFKYELSFLFGTVADAAAVHCIELDAQQPVGGTVFNFGFQFNFDSGIYVWDRSLSTLADTGKGVWRPTGIACPRWTANQWVTVVAEVHRSDAAVFYDGITVSGTHNALTQTYAAPQLGFTDACNCAVQLDSNGSGTPFRVYTDRIRFTCSTI